MATFTGKISSRQNRHPLLTEPVLYVADPPKHVKWAHLRKIFNSCGTVTTTGKRHVSSNESNAEKDKREMYPVRFANLFEAEMALATLQGVTVAGKWQMVLSHSPRIEKSEPTFPRKAQFVLKYDRAANIREDLTPQMVFKWFRSVGPLVSVRTNVNMGYLRFATVIEYWDDRDADVAHTRTNSLHRALQNLPAFNLRSFDPLTLRFWGFILTPHVRSEGEPGISSAQRQIKEQFSLYGTVRSVCVTNWEKFNVDGVVTFESPHSVTRILQAMDRQKVGPFVLNFGHEEADPDYSTESSYNCQARSTVVDEAEQQAKGAAAREKKELEEREARETAEAKVMKMKELQRRREEAQRSYDKAREDLLAAQTEEALISQELLAARSVQSEADQELSNTKAACAALREQYLAAIEREGKATRRATGAQENVADTLRRKQDKDGEIMAAKLDEMTSRMEKEMLDRELARVQNKVDEEVVRKAELAESIRRMQALKAEEELAKMKRVQQERSAAAEERLRREREEVERAAREQREREEKEREEAESRQRAYDKAVEAELTRCRVRDSGLWSTAQSAKQREHCALKRFKHVSEEFDTIAFQESQPLTVASIPWPIIAHPHNINLKAIEWVAVEKFFKAAERLSKNNTEYKALIEKAHRRFHPDKWRARGILSSVLDEGLRKQLEAAGNVVAQAITPLWLESRK